MFHKYIYINSQFRFSRGLCFFSEEKCAKNFKVQAGGRGTVTLADKKMYLYG